MQNHERKKRFNNTDVNVMAAISIGAMLIFSVAGIQAFADNIQDDIQVSPAEKTITEGGSVTVNYWVDANNAGGASFAGCDAADGSSLKITFNVVPDGVTVSPTSLTFSQCGDEDTNTKSATYSSDTPGDYAITVSAQDSAGNYNTNPAKFTLHVTEDTTPPTPTDTTPPVVTSNIVGTEGNNGWYTSDVEVTWTVTDDESTITSKSAACDETTTISQDTDGQTVTCEATSAGGTTKESVIIKRDATAPTVSLVGGPEDGGSYFFGFVPSEPTCEASDPTNPGSGLAGDCTVDGYGQSVGEHTVTASAKDNAGNTASDTLTYTVKNWVLDGFYQPVDRAPTVNTLKGGQTVPFKFDISAATEFTSTTFNGNPIGTFSAKKVSCSSAVGEDPIEVTATGGTSFRYDSTSGQFVYNWQTPKGAGICYDTTFTTQDGSTLTAHFQTK